jgi:radical SAM superfamily enzyme YgiQ (UPF0313 family)
MKILLVLPASAARRVIPGGPVPRRAMLRFSVLSLTVVAALTPPEHEVTLVDENVEPLDPNADADLVGISFMTALAPRAYELAAAFRARGKTVVAGGYHPTLIPDEVGRHFDSVVIGEAEGQWPTLLDDFAHGRLRPVYRRAWPCDPLQIPTPRRDLSASKARHYVTTAAVQATRGCPHACSYCSIAAFHGNRLRTRPTAAVFNEVRRLPRHFMFVDDNLIADRAFARRLLEALVPLRKRWVSQCSLLIAEDGELLRLARRAGCRGLFIGLESLDPGNLGAVGKSFNRAEEYGRRLAAIRRAGIGIVAGIIVGMDQDDRTVFERTLRFLDWHHIDALQLNILTPLPGTPLFEQFQRDGRILDRDWSHYDFRHVVIRPSQMTPEELQAGADWLYREFYRPHRILRRTASALLTLGPLAAWLSLRLNLTYLRDNRRDGIVGWNPAAGRPAVHRARAAAARIRPADLTGATGLR